MKSKIRFNIGRKIFFFTMVPFLMAMIAISTLTIQNKIKAEKELMRTRLDSYTHLLESGALSFESIAQKSKLESIFKERILVAELIKEDYSTPFTTDIQDSFTSLDRTFVDKSFKEKLVIFLVRKGLYNYISPIIYNNYIVGVFHVQFLNTGINKRIVDYSYSIILFNFFGILISFFLIRFLVKERILKGFTRLMEGSKKIASGNLNTVVNIDSNDELGDLADSFNKMVLDLQKTTVSRDKLVLEINARKRGEEELRIAYEQLKEAQMQLVQSAKMASIGQIASGVAHEVRNPLGIILQGVNYLESRLSVREADILETLTILKDNINRANNIINSMLDFSRAANLGLKAEDINSILGVSLTLMKTRFKSENIDTIVEIKKDIPKVLADKNKLEQVFINILLNAAQAMPDGGKIVIRSFDKKLEEIKNGIGMRAQDNFQLGERVVIVEIEDTGIGIPEENLKRIFDPFFTTKGKKGIGLGLSVTGNIIYIHRGLIYVESKFGQGTKMTVILKVAET